MELCHKNSILENPAIRQLGQFVSEHAKEWDGGVPDLEQYERELHKRMMAIECELLGEELARYDMSVAQIKVADETYRPTLTSTETYLSGAGLVTVTRHLYRPAGRGSKSICPLELRAGIVAGYFTPRAARQAAFVTAQLTPGESAVLFIELEGMRPSRASLDRLPKTLSAHWEQHRQDFESALRAQETVPQWTHRQPRNRVWHGGVIQCRWSARANTALWSDARKQKSLVATTTLRRSCQHGCNSP
jgi:hypothetical protein